MAANPKPAISPFRFRVILNSVDAVRVTLQVPNLEGQAREDLEGELARFGGRISLADGGCELSSSGLAGGTECDLSIPSLHSLLSGSANLLSEANLSDELFDQLSKLMPSVSDPMIFVEEMVPGHFVEWNSDRKIPKGRRVLLVTSRVIAEPDGLLCLTEVAGVNFLEVQLSTAKGLSHLNRAGVNVEAEPIFEIIGGIHVAEGILGPVFARGMPVLLRRTKAGGAGEWIIKSNAAGQLRLGEKDIAAILDDTTDHQEIRVETDEAAAATKIDFSSGEETARLLSIQLDPPAPSIEDIQRGQLRIQINAPMDLTDVGISVTVAAAGNCPPSAFNRQTGCIK